MSCGHPGELEQTVTDIREWLIHSAMDDFDCTVITTYPGTPYDDVALPHPDLANVWTYIHPKTGDRLHAREVDYTVCADYYEGDPHGGYRSFIFTDHLSAERLVELRDMVERDVRKALNIPFNPGVAALRYENSIGQGLPDFIHRSERQRTM